MSLSPIYLTVKRSIEVEEKLERRKDLNKNYATVSKIENTISLYCLKKLFWRRHPVPLQKLVPCGVLLPLYTRLHHLSNTPYQYIKNERKA